MDQLDQGGKSLNLKNQSHSFYHLQGEFFNLVQPQKMAK